jgi:hypothetical protein
MIIRLKKKGVTFILAVMLTLTLSFLTVSKQQLMIMKDDVVQYLMSMNLGFASRTDLVDPGDGLYFRNYESLYRKDILPALFNAIPKIIKYKISDADFERIDIDIKYIDYLKIMEDRDEAFKLNYLTNPTKINAKIRFRGKTYKSKLRRKGDRIGHWMGNYRASFRVSLNGNNTILGFKTFSIQKPSNRQYPYDYAFQSMIRGAGGLSAVHKFAHVYVNGTDWGIMDIEEHMSKKFLEKLKRKESIIVRFSNDKKRVYERNNQEPFLRYRLSDPSLNVHLYNSKKYIKNYQYRRIYSYILMHHLSFNPHLYDIDSFARAFILTTAWMSNYHTLTDYNSRYYFNPYTLKLEPITTDHTYYKKKFSFNTTYLPRQYLSVLFTQSYKDNLAKNLSAVNKVVSETQQYLDDAMQFFPVGRRKDGSVVVDNMKEIMGNVKKHLTLDRVLVDKTALHQGYNKVRGFNFDYLFPDGRLAKSSMKLPTRMQASKFEEHLHVRHYADGRMEFYNLLPDDVTVKDILFDGKKFLENEFIVPAYTIKVFPVVIATQILGIQDNRIIVKTGYKGFIRQVKNKITLVSDGLKNPLILHSSRDAGFLKALRGGDSEFKKGNWIINKPIVVNGNLHIPAGVNLKFSPNAYLIVKGALSITGDERKPVILEPSLDSWKGVYVLKANKRSSLKHVLIKNITSLEDGLLRLTGGITFYKSDVDLENVKIEGVKAEDAINIIESDFSINFVSVSNTTSDGLDSDFSRGTVSQSIFSNIGGDALDFSGSDVEIEGLEVINVKDKAISGGEKSIVNISNSTFKEVSIGIASKDGSSVFARNTSILKYGRHAVMSYIKKDFYGVPEATLLNCQVDRGNPYARQIGTNMVVDGLEVLEIEIDVEKLYQNPS